jgi:hypothetical protein
MSFSRSTGRLLDKGKAILPRSKKCYCLHKLRTLKEIYKHRVGLVELRRQKVRYMEPDKVGGQRRSRQVIGVLFDDRK